MTSGPARPPQRPAAGQAGSLRDAEALVRGWELEQAPEPSQPV